MPIVRSLARWLADRLSKRQKLRLAIRWYELKGLQRLSAEEKIAYAGMLHENGSSERAVATLTDLLGKHEVAQAYERRAHIYNETGREEDAIADLDAAIRLDPEPYLVWYTRAISHNNRGEYESAARDFREAARRRGDSKASTYYELGNVYMKMGRDAEAEESYRLAASEPEHAIPHYYYRHAQALDRLNRRDEALSALSEGIRLHDEWRRAQDRGAAFFRARTRYSPSAIASFIQGAEEEFGFRAYQATLLEAKGQIDAACEALDTAIRRYPSAIALQLRKARLLREADRADEAARSLLELLATHPQALAAHLELSAVRRAQGKLEEAVLVLEEAKKQAPKHPVVRFWLTDALRDAGRAEAALEENGELLKLEPEDPLNWKQRAEMLLEAERFREAEEAYTRALEREQAAETYMRRSFARYRDNRYEEAMMDIQSAGKIDPGVLKSSKTAYALGELYMGIGNAELADGEYSKALALEPDNPQIYERRARCRYAADRFEEALEDCKRGLQLTGANAKLIWLRGLIHYRMDDLEGARMDLSAYAELEPDDAQAYYNLGLIYKQMDQPDDAIGCFTKVIELNPFDGQAYYERAGLWYRHSFDRIRAADDLAQWLLYAESEARGGDRFELLNEIRGFDDEMRERAKEQFLRVYGSSRYLS
ncbi:tetratricopeptide repeat protein [Paenibacillaceae bacterium WGS1546]|uniref:tetratricopeptide repeat protein n=1 Tax=Cohnella sp. WGS1546 TaxID=3366810 RepID=UPI00372D1BE8